MISCVRKKKFSEQYHLKPQPEIYSINSCGKKIKRLPNNIISQQNLRGTVEVFCEKKIKSFPHNII